MACKWQVEIDDYANRVLAKHWPSVHRERDIRAVGRHNLERVDVICGGFPCQPHSFAGPLLGAADERNLWPEYLRIIREIKPRWVVGENVPGIRATDAGRFFGGILRDLAGLGYDAEWSTVSAEQFGSPHLRERVFIIAYPSGTRRERLVKYDSIPESAQTPYSVYRHRSARSWMEVVRSGGIVRSGDGLSVGVERRRIKQCGNAILPQVAEWIGRRIIEAVK